MKENLIALRISNSLDSELTLYVEPWGDQHFISKGATLIVEARGPEGDTLEIEYGINSITIYGWPDSVVQLIKP
jgi:hypothetical protein